MTTFEELEAKITDRSARIAIIGLGYAGVPETVISACPGFLVIGFDLIWEQGQKHDRAGVVCWRAVDCGRSASR